MRLRSNSSPTSFALAGLALFLQGIAADAVQARPGTFAFESLTQTLTAEQTALGGLHACAEGGPEALRANPASLAAANGPQGSVSHQGWQTGLREEWVGGVLPCAGGSLGVDLSALHAGELPSFDEDGKPLGTFMPVEIIAGVGYAHPLGRAVQAGVALHGLYLGGPEDDLRGISIDGGTELSHGDTRIALTVRNLGPNPRGGHASYRLPSTAAMGLEQEIGSRLRVNATVTADRDGLWTGSAGARAEVPGGVSLLGGAAYSPDAQAAPLSPRVGISMNVRVVRFTYAYASSDVTGPTHHVSLRFTPR
jgi:hypothetical protein